jgi:hypothetical protein
MAMQTLNILLVVFMLATLVVLGTGVVGFLLGGEFNRRWGNQLMRARVALQAVAIVILAILFLANS